MQQQKGVCGELMIVLSFIPGRVNFVPASSPVGRTGPEAPVQQG